MSLESKLIVSCQTQYGINNNLVFVLEWRMKGKELIIYTYASCLKDNLFIIVLRFFYNLFGLFCQLTSVKGKKRWSVSRAHFRVQGSGFICLRLIVFIQQSSTRF